MYFRPVFYFMLLNTRRAKAGHWAQKIKDIQKCLFQTGEKKDPAISGIFFLFIYRIILFLSRQEAYLCTFSGNLAGPFQIAQ